MASNQEVEITVLENSKVVAQLKTTTFPIIFGRSPECSIKLGNFEYISRTHGTITYNNGQIRVSDLNSRNGITYRGSKNIDFILEKNADSFKVVDLTFNIKLLNIVDLPVTVSKLGITSEESIVVYKPKLPEAPFNDQSQDKFVTHQQKTNQDQPVKFSILPVPGLQNTHPSLLCLQAVISWDGDIFDVRNFYVGDQILLSDKEESPIYIPFLKKTIKYMGKYANDGGYIDLSSESHWSLFSGEMPYDESMLTREGRLKKSNQKVTIKLNLTEVLSAELGLGICLHFRYVPVPRPFIRKTWIENREEFKKATWTSGLIHAVISIFALLSAPKLEAPKLPDIPPRIAKLIVEPPPQIITPPPPKKEIISPVEPKTEAKVEKIIKKPEIVVPKPMVEKVKQARVDKTYERIEKKRLQETPPSSEVALENLFKSNTISKNPGIKLDSKNFNVAMNNSSKFSPNQGFSNLSNALKNKKSELNSGFQSGDGGGAAIGKINFAQNSSGSKTGKRNIEGAVLGSPKIIGKLDGSQGLTNDAVMSVVNKYLGDVQRCYERALFADSTLAGRVEYEWDIEPSGGVSGVRIKRSEMARADSLNECVISIFRKMKFPSSKNGKATVANIGFPFGKH